MSGYKGWEDFDPMVKHVVSQKPRKYHNEPMEIDGHVFPSKREANRYLHLRELLGKHEISDLELQPRFPLHVVRPDGVRVEVASYVGDFKFWRGDAIVVEDSKGFRTAIYALKKKMVEAEYGIVIVEV